VGYQKTEGARPNYISMPRARDATICGGSSSRTAVRQATRIFAIGHAIGAAAATPASHREAAEGVPHAVFGQHECRGVRVAATVEDALGAISAIARACVV